MELRLRLSGASPAARFSSGGAGGSFYAGLFQIIPRSLRKLWLSRRYLRLNLRMSLNSAPMTIRSTSGAYSRCSFQMRMRHFSGTATSHDHHVEVKTGALHTFRKPACEIVRQIRLLGEAPRAQVDTVHLLYASCFSSLTVDRVDRCTVWVDGTCTGVSKRRCHAAAGDYCPVRGCHRGRAIHWNGRLGGGD